MKPVQVKNCDLRSFFLHLIHHFHIYFIFKEKAESELKMNMEDIEAQLRLP